MNSILLFCFTLNHQNDEEVLNTFLEEIRKLTLEYKIKGFLIHSNGNILQVLEGEKIRVLKIFEEISTDLKYKDIFKIYDNKTTEVYFQEEKEFIIIKNGKQSKILEEYLKSKKNSNPKLYRILNYIINKFLE